MRRGLKYTAVAFGAALAIVVGFGFLTFALYAAISAEIGPISAAALLGVLLVLIGGVLLLLLKSLGDAHHHSEPDMSVGSLLDAFLEGQRAGSKAKDSRDLSE